MPKIQIKYVTRANEEHKKFLSAFAFKEDVEEYFSHFLADDNHFSLMVYAFGKLAGLICLNNNETDRSIELIEFYTKDYTLIKEVMNFLTNKFKGYQFKVTITKDNRGLVGALKKMGGKEKNGVVTLPFSYLM